MEALERLYGKWISDLAPGVKDKAAVVRDRILYRSAEDEHRQAPRGYTGYEMDPEKGDFLLPISDPRQKPTSKAKESSSTSPASSADEMLLDSNNKKANDMSQASRSPKSAMGELSASDRLADDASLEQFDRRKAMADSKQRSAEL